MSATERHAGTSRSRALRPTRLRLPLAGLLLALLIGGRVAVAAADALPGEGEERPVTLAPGEEVAYAVTLAADEFLHVAVEQLSVDVELELADVAATEERNEPIDSMPWAWGVEELLALPDAETTLRLTVRSAGRRPGEAVVRIVARRPATARDRAVHSAQQRLLATRTQRARNDVDEELLASAYRAAEAFAELGLPGRQARALARAATVLILLGRPQEALEPAERAIAVAESAGEAWEACDARLKRAEAIFSVSVPEALAEERRILERIRDAPAPPCELMTRRLLVYDLAQSGALGEALENFRLALPLARRLDAPWEEASLHLNVSSVHKALGDPQADLESNAEAHRLFESLGDTALAAAARSNMVAVLFDMQDFEGALRAQSGVIQVLEKDGELHSLSLEWLLHGRILEALDRVQEAAGAFETAIEIATEANEPHLVANGERHLGSLALAAGDTAGAKGRFSHALAAHLELGRTVDVAHDRLGLAAADASDGRVGEALAGYREVAASARDLGNLPLEIQALEGMARCLWRSRDPEARTHLDRAIELTENVRRRIPSDRLRTTYSRLQRRLYDLAIEMTLADPAPVSGDPVEAAFLLAERARARALHDFLETAPADARVRTDRDLVEREERAFARLAQLEGELVEVHSDDDARTREIRTEIALFELELEEMAAERTRRHPRRGAFLAAELPSLVAMRRALGGATLVSFHLMEERGLGFLLTAEDLRMVELPGRAEIERKVASLRERLERPSRRLAPLAQPAVRLWTDLLEPLLGPISPTAEDAPPRRLLISPDGPLHGLPFEALLLALPASGAVGGTSSTAPFLVRSFEISYVPSAAVLARLVETEELHDGTVVAWTDPAAAAHPRAGDGSVAGSRTSGTIAPLPHARAEGLALERILGADRTTLLMGPDATESFARDGAASRAAYLHFAAHGFVDAELPHRSSLLLAPDDRHDGTLQMREVLRMELAAELVALSACRTGAGAEGLGEGVLSLSRAFLFAGSSSLLASLWDVSDRATSSLMETLYTRLRDGHGKAASLRLAKLHLLDRPETAHPYYWAPFLLSGVPD